jgi:two-component system, OmpR family, phosphate regulon sensor histidine kinase PhoR
MNTNPPEALADVLDREHKALLASWRDQVRKLPSARDLDVPTLNDHVPQLIKELAAALRERSGQTIPDAFGEGSPLAHGLQRVEDGFDIEEVVAEYNILRGCIHDLCERHGLALQGRSFHVVNGVLDQAIGLAVQTFATGRALEVQRRREEYLAFVAHDLRTPLSAIALAARVLELRLKKARDDAEITRMLKTLQRNVRHLDELVHKILEENANLQTEAGVRLQRRTFDLWPLVEALVHDLHPVAGTASTELVNDVAEDQRVCADAGLLSRIFQNLIANAIRYTPRGRIVISAQPVDGGRGLECRVSDNGAGIPAELLDRVFDKGQTDAEAGGTGLGLAIVKTFTEAHGGTVTVESQVGVGSTFRFTLPDQPG